MSIIHRLFGRDDNFYRLLQDSAGEAQKGAAALVRLVNRLDQGAVDALRTEVDQSRRDHKRISQQITEQLCATFVTPLEREDIEVLNTAVYKISKTLEKIADRLVICPPGLNLEPLKKQLALLEQGTGVVAEMVGEMSARKHSELVRGSYERIQAIEADADRVMNELLRDLYQGEADARGVVFSKDIYELLEKAIDRCRDAGSILFHITLKNA